MARPNKSADKVKNEKIVTRVNEVELRRFEEAAEADGMPVATWLRFLGIQAAKKHEAAEAGKAA